MKFGELPPNIQTLLKGKTEGRVLFRPPQDSPSPQRYVPFQAGRSVVGPLWCIEILDPPGELYLRGSRRLGFGDGFSVCTGRLVVENIESSVKLKTKHAARYMSGMDLTLDFFVHNSQDFFITSQRVFRLLTSLGCIEPGYSCDVFHRTPDGVELSEWKFVDFPRTPIIDYGRSLVDWEIRDMSKMDGSSFGAEDPDRLSYFPDMRGLASDFRLADGPDSKPIVREKYLTHTFISRATLEVLKDNGVRGPDYGVLEVPPRSMSEIVAQYGVYDSYGNCE